EISSIEKTFEDGEISYEVEMTTKAGAERFFVLTAEGELDSEQVTLEETPAAVRKTIETQVGAAQIGEIVRNFDEDGVTYEVVRVFPGGSRSFVVAVSGRLERIEVLLPEVTTDAQKVIIAQIGDGKLIGIDKVFGKKKQFTYEIEARKGGKPVSFNVGPKGVFLGMND
ncbi:MAG TPA: hypothetical protein VGH65_05735, partial [Verrucomicrobiaceae bacterium]